MAQSIFTRVPQEVIDREIQAIANANGGRISRQMVVEAAEDPSHPLHYCFEWTDADAAEQFRLIQAGRLISSVQVITRTTKTVVTSVAYVKDPELGRTTPGYRSTVDVAKDPEGGAEVLRQDMARIRGHMFRTVALAEQFDQLEDLKGEVGQMLRDAGLGELLA